MKKNEIEKNQICYCEKYGIIESVTKKDKMIFYSSYPSEHCNYKIIVDLKRKKEVSRKLLSRYYKKGEVNKCI